MLKVLMRHHPVNVNTSGLSHNRDGALLGEDTEQTLECHQGRRCFPRTFLPLHFPMLGGSGPDSAPLSLGTSRRKAADDLQSEALGVQTDVRAPSSPRFPPHLTLLIKKRPARFLSQKPKRVTDHFPVVTVTWSKAFIACLHALG